MRLGPQYCTLIFFIVIRRRNDAVNKTVIMLPDVRKEITEIVIVTQFIESHPSIVLYAFVTHSGREFNFSKVTQYKFMNYRYLNFFFFLGNCLAALGLISMTLFRKVNFRPML